MGWRGLSPRITLTTGEVRIDAGFLRRRETVIQRSDIRSAVIYEGVVTVLALPFLLFDRWLIRKAYGGPYNCDSPPETFGPGTGKHI